MWELLACCSWAWVCRPRQLGATSDWTKEFVCELPGFKPAGMRGMHRKRGKRHGKDVASPPAGNLPQLCMVRHHLHLGFQGLCGLPGCVAPAA